MTPEQQAANYRTQRNASLKREQVLRETLKSLGADDAFFQHLDILHSQTEPTISDGKITKMDISKEQTDAALQLLANKGLVPSGQASTTKTKQQGANEGGGKTETNPGKEAKELTLQDIISASVTAAVTAINGGAGAGAGNEKPANTVQMKGGTKPAKGVTGAGGTGYTAEDLNGMSVEQIMANWDDVKTAMSSGILNGVLSDGAPASVS